MINNLIVTITGFSATGKSTVQKMLDSSGVAVEVLSHTNRPKRGDDDRRIFVSTEEFQEMEKEGRFCQVVEYDGYRYALERARIQKILETGEVPLLDVSQAGLQQIVDADLAPVLSVFLTASPAQLKARLLQRKDPDPTVVRRRLNRALAEAEGINSGAFQVIQNNDVGETVRKITRLIQGGEVVSDPFDLAQFKKEMVEVLKSLGKEEEK